jgi:tripartite-type tricarboxylate transporter receptor subunit TctC
MKKTVVITLVLLSSLFLSSWISLNSWAGDKKYPSRDIEIYFGFAGGSFVDAQTRFIASKLEKLLGVHVIPVPKPGGGGIVATNLLIDAPPDGYAIANVSYNSIYETIRLSQGKLSLENIKIVSQWNAFGETLCVSADSEWKTFQEFVEFARKNPGVKYGHGGVGTSAYRRIENLNRNANLKMIGVPFSGAELVTAVLGKHVPIAIIGAQTAKSQSDGGKMRILFCFDPPTKFGLDPTIPHIRSVFDKSIVDRDIQTAGFFIAPGKTPDNIIMILQSAIENVLRDTEVIDGLIRTGLAVDFLDSKAGTQKMISLMENIKAMEEK